MSSYPTQSPYSNADVRHAEDALTHFFQQDGYFEAEVHAETVIDSAHNLVNVVFNTSLGRRAKIGQIQTRRRRLRKRPLYLRANCIPSWLA